MNVKLLCKYVVFILILIISGCNKSKINTNISKEEKFTPASTPHLQVPVFTPQEVEYLNQLRLKGKLKVSAYFSPGSFEEDSNDQYSGFQYDLIMGLSDYLDIDIEIKKILFTENFSNNGEIPDSIKTNSSLTYTPDVFKDSDICTGFITILPWRMQIMDMISYLPVRQMFISRNDDSITTLSDLNGKKIGYGIGTSYETTLSNIKNSYNKNFLSVPYKFEEKLIPKVSQGSIDGTIIDLQNLLLSLKEYPNLVAELPADDIEQVGWGVKKGNDLLRGLIQKYFHYAYETGLIERVFINTYSIGLKDYYSLIEYEGVELHELELSDAEFEWLINKRSTGTLSIATINSQEVYQVNDDGSITGFDYKIANSFAQTLGLKLDINIQDDITGFFAKDGVFDPEVTTNPNLVYSPNLLDKVDIYAGPFSIVPWREKLMTMIPMMPMGQILASRAGDEIKDFAELNGKRVAVLAGSYQETFIKNLMEEKGFSANFSYMQTTDEPLNFVKSGKADYLIDGAVYITKGMNNLEGMAVSPIKIDVVTVGWAVNKNNLILESILNKYINKMLSNGNFGRIWKETNGVDFEYYLNMIKE